MEQHGRLEVIRSGAEFRRRFVESRREGVRTGLVPTMGALHEGHLSLVRAALDQCPRTAATIFVNPAQFAPGEDLARYPRTLDADLAALERAGASWVFVPDVDELYPRGFSTYVEPPAVARLWEGECRPGHFRGVCTVVLKLLQLGPADVACFGQKDYQQAQVIRAMVRDLSLPVEIEICPTVRDEDGLALSSRNRYLSPADRRRALALPRALRRCEQRIRGGERRPDELLGELEESLRSAFDALDYVALCDPDTLEPAAAATPPLVALAAARIGGTRLIDNLVVR